MKADDQWNPTQYNKFKEQRSKPFYDLLQIVRPATFEQVIDLGCGTGELTKKMHEQVKAVHTIGMDASRHMLEGAEAFITPGLTFELSDIYNYQPKSQFDLIFSNAALQWVENHEVLFPKILSWLQPKGQIAFQMPNNYDHPSHLFAEQVAQELFPGVFAVDHVKKNLLDISKYAEILFANGCTEQTCRMEVYGHYLPSGSDVIEWTKGTLLTSYQAKLTNSQFQDFLQAYSTKLLQLIGNKPYFYPFKRILLWGKKG
jgi:trans-aconitate 2-methyltransferase